MQSGGRTGGRDGQDPLLLDLTLGREGKGEQGEKEDVVEMVYPWAGGGRICGWSGEGWFEGVVVVSTLDEEVVVEKVVEKVGSEPKNSQRYFFLFIYSWSVGCSRC